MCTNCCKHFVLKVDDTEAFPNYPYRDDALLIFEVIYDYVREVLEAFYGKQKICSSLCDNQQQSDNWMELL